MKNSTNISIVSLLALAFLVSPVATFAQIGLQNNLAGEATIGNDIKANLDTSVDVNVGSNGDDSVGSGNSDTQSNSEAMLQVNTSGVSITSSGQVVSDADLNVFEANISAQNKSVSKVKATTETNGETEVIVVFRHNGKFVGLFPVAIKSTTTVQSRGETHVEVKSKLPWWGFLVANKNYNKAKIESSIAENPTVVAEIQLNANASQKAKVAEAVVAEMQTQANAEAKASVK